MSARFPNLTIRLEYHEPMMSFEGHAETRQGAVTDREQHDFDFHERYQ